MEDKPGIWIKQDEKSRSYKYICSLCYDTAYSISKLYKFCPNCGKKMRTDKYRMAGELEATDKQKAFAKDIAQKLDLELPEEETLSAYMKFISAHIEEFKAT